MRITFKLRRNSLSPELRRMARGIRDTRSLHEALGLGLVSLAKRAFNQPALRPKAWPPLKGGGAARLRKSGTLAKAQRVTSVSTRNVTVGNDRPYGAIHQLGGRTAARTIRPKNRRALRFQLGGRTIFAKKVKHPGSDVPPRPYLPFHSDGRLSAEGTKLVERVIRARVQGRRR